MMTSKTSYKWDAKDYATHSSAQLTWANELIHKLTLCGTESVLDIGCGDGKITARIAAGLKSGHILGIDNSTDMIDLAQKTFPLDQHPNLRFEKADACSLSYLKCFDVVFSSAALHWIPHTHLPVLTGIKNSMTPGARMLLQMGGKGNAAAILKVLELLMDDPLWMRYFKNFSFSYGFFDPDTYTSWLIQAGLSPKRVELIPKMMSYDSTTGLAGWIRTTWLPYTQCIPQPLKEQFINQVVDRYMALYPLDRHQKVQVKMVRLEVEATLP